jgi:hypothetical protein
MNVIANAAQIGAANMSRARCFAQLYLPAKRSSLHLATDSPAMHPAYNVRCSSRAGGAEVQSWKVSCCAALAEAGRARS